MRTRFVGAGVLALSAGLFLVGCPPETKDPTGDTPPKPSASASGKTTTTADPSGTTPSASASGSATPEPPPSGGLTITPRAKAELDGKEPDAAYKGSALSVTGAKYGFTVPAGWTTASEPALSKAAAEGDKAKFGATGYADGDDTAKKAEGVLQGLGLTGCTWGADEDIALGKDKVPAKVADGVCKRDKVDVRAIRAVVAGNAKLVAVGAWDDPGGDDKGVLESFRSLAEGKSIAACCSALSGNMVNAPLEQKPIYAAALAVCQSLANSKEGRDALGQIRGKLPGVSIPAACN